MSSQGKQANCEVSIEEVAKIAERLSVANDSLFDAIAVSDGMAAIVDGFRDNNEPGTISPAQVSMLLECLQNRLSSSLVDIMQALGDASEVLPFE
ncbi:hypothetical protein [Idiomarina abyssalis]|uniref:hypothetical protein n=1 Tax=Idiomarina abyssalis TaxID=86102 RepID=UPI001CD42852|nr:hypothetical protein [Idiomarina abyssalis]